MYVYPFKSNDDVHKKSCKMFWNVFYAGEAPLIVAVPEYKITRVSVNDATIDAVIEGEKTIGRRPVWRLRPFSSS